MINFWKLAYEAVKEQRDTLIEENKYLKLDIERWIDNELEARELANKHMKQKCLVEKENEQLKQQIEHLKENYESNRKHNKNLIERNKELEHENKALRLQSDTYFNEWQEAKEENEQLKIKNEYLVNVIEMAENIQIHSDVEDE